MMRQARRLLALSVSGLLAFFLLATPHVGLRAEPSDDGSAEELIADEQGWVTSLQVADLGDPLAQSTLGPGDLPVGLSGTSESKRSYLMLDLPEEATGATLTLARSDSTAVNLGVAGPVLACLVTEVFLVETGGPIDEAPEVDCDDEVVGEAEQLEEGIDDPDGAYTFVLDPLVARWAAGEPNEGIALVGDTRTPGNYQLTFNADYFEPIGTYTMPAGDSGSASDDFSPPPAGGSDGVEGFAPDSGSSSDPPPFTTTGPDVPAGQSSVPEVEQPAPPDPVAAEQDEDDPAGGGVPSAAEPLSQPLEPLPMNPAVWLLLPLGVSALWASGRGLTTAGEVPSSLDRLLANVR